MQMLFGNSTTYFSQIPKKNVKKYKWKELAKQRKKRRPLETIHS